MLLPLVLAGVLVRLREQSSFETVDLLHKKLTSNNETSYKQYKLTISALHSNSLLALSFLGVDPTPDLLERLDRADHADRTEIAVETADRAELMG